MAFNIYHDVFINASPKKVFECISKPELLEKWWPLKCSGELKLGAIQRYFFSREYDWLMEVIRYEPDTAFYLSMLKTDNDWAPTTIRYDLKKSDMGTSLSFSHINWPECNHHFKRSSWCWAVLLKGMKDYLEKGTIVPFEERA